VYPKAKEEVSDCRVPAGVAAGPFAGGESGKQFPAGSAKTRVVTTQFVASPFIDTGRA